MQDGRSYTKPLTTGVRLERLLLRELHYQFEDLEMERDKRQLIIPTVVGIPRRRKDIEYYEEWEELHTVFRSVLVVFSYVVHMQPVGKLPTSMALECLRSDLRDREDEAHEGVHRAG